MTAVLEAIRRVLYGTGSTAFTLVGAILIGFGVPLFWIFLASQLYGKTGAVTGPVAAFIGTGILVSYWGLLLIASWVRGRMLARESGHRRGARDPWNRSMRDTPYRPGDHRSDPVERLFVATAIISLIGFAIWFAFFAGAPFPNNPGQPSALELGLQRGVDAADALGLADREVVLDHDGDHRSVLVRRLDRKLFPLLDWRCQFGEIDRDHRAQAIRGDPSGAARIGQQIEGVDDVRLRWHPRFASAVVPAEDPGSQYGDQEDQSDRGSDQHLPVDPRSPAAECPPPSHPARWTVDGHRLRLRGFDPEFLQARLADVSLRRAVVVDVAALVAGGDDLEWHRLRLAPGGATLA